MYFARSETIVSTSDSKLEDLSSTTTKTTAVSSVTSDAVDSTASPVDSNQNESSPSDRKPIELSRDIAGKLLKRYYNYT